MKATATKPLLICNTENKGLFLNAPSKKAFTACVSIIQIQAIPRRMSMKVSLCGAMRFETANSGKFANDFECIKARQR
jgi:hypothetical protein